jgi:hypothetical protein
MRCGAVVARRPEVALTEGERVAQAPRLHEPHQRVVDRGVTMRVELTHDVTDDAGALRESFVWSVASVIHRVDHAAVNGLQTVPHLGQRTPNDDAHRVVEIRALHLELEVDLRHLVVREVDLLARNLRVVAWCDFVSHLCSFLAVVIEWRMSRCRGSERLSRSFE